MQRMTSSHSNIPGWVMHYDYRGFSIERDSFVGAWEVKRRFILGGASEVSYRWFPSREDAEIWIRKYGAQQRVAPVQ